MKSHTTKNTEKMYMAWLGGIKAKKTNLICITRPRPFSLTQREEGATLISVYTRDN